MSDVRDEDRPPMSGDWTPRPDPTTLTDRLVNNAVGNLEARILVRLDAMDKATDYRIEQILKIPNDTDRQIQHLADFIEQQFKTVDVRFEGIAKQFEERDIRVETGARASAEALSAALLAAKELVGTTNEANTIAARKSEESVAKQIDAILAQFRTSAEATDARIADLKERIDRGEGGASGAQQFRTEQRLDTGSLVAIIAVVLVIVAIGIGVVEAIVSGAG